MNLGNIEKGYVTNRFKDEHVSCYLIVANNGTAYGAIDDDEMHALTPDEVMEYFIKGCVIGEGGSTSAGFIPVNAYFNSDEQVVLSYFDAEGTLKTCTSAMPVTDGE
jgi:hypothetical protein